MAKTIHDQTIALAATLQFAYGVHDIASRGYCDSKLLRTAIKSVLSVNASDAVSIYGDKSDLRSGIEKLRRQLETPVNDLPTRYAMAMIALEKALSRNKKVLDTLTTGIEKAQHQADFFQEDAHDNVVAGLADLYQKTLSTLTPKIMVNGEAQYLQNEKCAAQIRTLLLAGIRSIVLWRQSGGKKLNFLFKRKQYAQCVHELLKSA